MLRDGRRRAGCYWLLGCERDRWADELEGGEVEGGMLGEFVAQLPGEVGGEHADKDVAADPVFEVVVDGPQVQVVGLGDAEVPLDIFEVLVGGDGAGGIEGLGIDAGADHVDPVAGGLGGDLLLIAAPGETGAGDVADEMLADLVPADDLPGPLPDRASAFEPPDIH